MSEKLKSNLGLLVRKVPRHRFARALGAMLSSPVRNRAVHTPMPKTRHEYASVDPSIIAHAEIALSWAINHAAEPITVEEFSERIQLQRRHFATERIGDHFTEETYRNTINYLNTAEQAILEMVKGFMGYKLYAVQVWTNENNANYLSASAPHTDYAPAFPTVVLTGTVWGPSTSYYCTKYSSRIETPDQSLCGHVAGRGGALHSSPLYNKRKRNTVVVKLIKIK